MKKSVVICSVLAVFLFCGVGFAQEVVQQQQQQQAISNSGVEASVGNTNNNHTINNDTNVNIGTEGQPFIQSIEEQGDITTINRNFPNPGGTVLPQTNGFFTSPTPDSSFRNLKEILSAMSIHEEQDTLLLNEEALQSLARKGGVKAHIQTFRGPKQVERVKWSSERKLYITIKEPEGAIPVTLLDGEAKNGTTNSIHVIGRMGLLAIKNGCTHMVFTLQGAHRKVEAKGWGIGLHTNSAGVSQDGQVSAIGGGGLGYSSNVTGPEDRPWLQAVGVVDPDVVAREAAIIKAKKLEAKNVDWGYKKSAP